MNLRSALHAASETLARAGVDSPSLTAELLLAHVLAEPPLRLRLDLGRPLQDNSPRQFKNLVQHRAARIPLQHLIGTAPFLDLHLLVTPAVLIPRPETEGLALRASAILRALDRNRTVDALPRVLDFATGSGCLALYLAAQHPTAEVHALDESAAALDVARQNAQRLGLHDRVEFHLGDGFAALEKLSAMRPLTFDLLVTNPPYIPTAEISRLEPEVRDHDPHLALDGGADGQDFFRRLARESPAWLRSDGWILAEFGDGQWGALQQLFATHLWREIGVAKDLSGRDRILLAHAPGRSIA